MPISRSLPFSPATMSPSNSSTRTAYTTHTFFFPWFHTHSISSTVKTGQQIIINAACLSKISFYKFVVIFPNFSLWECTWNTEQHNEFGICWQKYGCIRFLFDVRDYPHESYTKSLPKYMPYRNRLITWRTMMLLLPLAELMRDTGCQNRSRKTIRNCV